MANDAESRYYENARQLISARRLGEARQLVLALRPTTTFPHFASHLLGTIARLEGYLHMADFGTCAIDWPLMDEWEAEIAAGKMPTA